MCRRPGHMNMEAGKHLLSLIDRLGRQLGAGCQVRQVISLRLSAWMISKRGIFCGARCVQKQDVYALHMPYQGTEHHIVFLPNCILAQLGEADWLVPFLCRILAGNKCTQILPILNKTSHYYLPKEHIYKSKLHHLFKSYSY